MLQYVARRRIVVCVLVAVLVALLVGTGATSVADGPIEPQSIPTEIDAQPNTQTIYASHTYPDCKAKAQWTIYLAGGTGIYDVEIDWGEGMSASVPNWVYSTLNSSCDYSGCNSKIIAQHWKATSQGMSDTDTTTVDYVY